MHQRSLIAHELPSKDTHDDANNKKSKSGSLDAVDMSKSDERSWLQARTAELILKEFPSGNFFENSDWSRYYAEARKEWDERQTL